MFKSAEIPRNPGQEEGVTHARKRNRPYAKVKFDLTSASTIVQNGRSFTPPLITNTWLIRFRSQLASRRHRTQQYKNTVSTYWTYQPPKTTSVFQRLIWEKRLYSNTPERHYSLQNSCVKASK